MFTGNKPLVLGPNVGSRDIVLYARSNGAYVYVTDNLDISESEAKRYADCVLPYSTDDFGELSKVIEEKKIDAVMSGISGFNICNSIVLSEKYNLPHYCTKEQWEMIEHKDNFRTLCDKYQVPCPKTYFCGDNVEDIHWNAVSFPAVLKPVDSGASSGVHICQTREEMESFFDDAFSHSEKHRIIIEEYIDGNEFTAHYTINNGKATLSCIDNRYPVAVHDGNVTTIPAARIYPSTFIDSYKEKVNASMLRLAESIKMKNGVVFIQGIHNSFTDEFRIFEAGCRSAAEAPYRIIEKVTGNNYLKMMVDSALGCEGHFDPKKEDPYLAGKCCGVVSFVARGGIVGAIKGLEEAVKKTSSVIEYESRYPVGSQTPNGDTLRQLMIRFIMISENRETMEKEIAFLNKNIDVRDTNGDDMVIKFDPKRLYNEA